jgi:excisionase family DNA binding protein
MQQILTVDEAAEILKVRPETVRRLLTQGKLPGNKVGRYWRIPSNALMEFLSGAPVATAGMTEPEWIDDPR